MDGIRALAVTAVVLYHLEVGWAHGGYLGVEVFFVVSGYLITSLLVSEHADHGFLDIGRFWARRARRLLPAGIALVGVVTLVGVVFARGELAAHGGDLVASLFQVQNWWAVLNDESYFASFGRPSPLRHMWSLGVEAQFYLIWPVVAVATLTRLGRHRARAVAVLGAATSIGAMAVLADPSAIERVYYGTDTRAFGLLIGAAFALVWHPARRLGPRPTSGRRRSVDLVALVGLLGLLHQLDTRSEFDPWTFPQGLVVVDAMTITLIAAAVTRGSLVGRVLGMRPLVAVGRRSYSLYLWHWPVFVFTRPGVDIGLAGLPAHLFRILLTCLLAEASYRWVELPVRDGRASAWLAAHRHELRRPRHRRVAVACASVVLVGLVAVGTRSEQTGTQRFEDEFVSAVGTGVEVTLPEPGVTTTTTVASSATTRRSTSTTTRAPTTNATREPSTTTTPVSAPASPTTTAPATPASEAGGPVSIIGESVTLGAADDLRARFPALGLDARVGRQVDESVSVVESLADSDQLGDHIVLHVGNNGVIPEGAFDRVLAAVGDRQLHLVTVSVPRRWEEQVNGAILTFVDAHPRVHIVDWYNAVAGEPGLLTDDRVHPTEEGAARYAELIAASIGG